MIPIGGNLHSSALTLNSQIIPLSDLRLIEQWREWTEHAEPGTGELRDIALSKLIACLEHHTSDLNLQDLNLTELPETFPDHITELDFSNNQLTRLPAMLPPQLEILYANHNRLTSLPGVLPARLKVLGIDDNRLTHFPETLPDVLEILYASHNQLTHLPAMIPCGLRELGVGYNQITLLPDIFPDGLETLDVDNNQLTYLPATLPTGLEILYADHNQLTYLPAALPLGLRELGLGHNQLTFLPEMLPRDLEILDVDNNRLSRLPATLPNGLEVLNASNNQLIHLPQTFPPELREINIFNNPLSLQTEILSPHILLLLTPPLKATIRLWTQNDDITLWEEIAQEENADHFSQFLKKLHRNQNASNASLRSIVSGWLADLAKEHNKAIRKQTFLIAQMGSESCVDRASYYFNQMHSLFIEHRLKQTSVSIAETVNTIRGLFRLQTLEKISASHVKRRQQEASGFSEDLEIYLAYQYKLREELGLPVYTHLQYENIANLSTTDIENAKSQILDTEKKKFLRHLVNHSEVWQKKIEDWNGKQWASANERYLEEIGSADFQHAVEDALKREGISSSDADAVRIMQQKMANEVLFQKRYPLTEAFLTENNALSLIGSNDKPPNMADSIPIL